MHHGIITQLKAVQTILDLLCHRHGVSASECCARSREAKLLARHDLTRLEAKLDTLVLKVISLKVGNTVRKYVDLFI